MMDNVTVTPRSSDLYYFNPNSSRDDACSKCPEYSLAAFMYSFFIRLFEVSLQCLLLAVAWNDGNQHSLQ